MSAVAKSFLVGILFLTGCRTPHIMVSPDSFSKEIRYSVIYLIHADADYLYHDKTGEAHQADKKVLEEARTFGKQAKQGEVIIYHLLPERKILWLFPRKDRRIMHYRNGELVADFSYSPSPEKTLFTAENQYFRQSRAFPPDKAQNYLLYFGHEIPAKNGDGYFRSLPYKKVNAQTFTDGIQNFLIQKGDYFNLAVLSTCNNGNPQIAHLMEPFTEVLLASPQNLHLSHIDTDSLLLLEKEVIPTDVELAKSIAETTFQRLSDELQTTITLSVYDLQKMKTYMADFYLLYDEYLKNSETSLLQQNIDCAELSIFEDLTNTDGINRWYQSSKFGRRSDVTFHSGWGCKPINLAAQQ